MRTCTLQRCRQAERGLLVLSLAGTNSKSDCYSCLQGVAHVREDPPSPTKMSQRRLHVRHLRFTKMAGSRRSAGSRLDSHRNSLLRGRLSSLQSATGWVSETTAILYCQPGALASLQVTVHACACTDSGWPQRSTCQKVLRLVRGRDDRPVR